MCQACHMRCCAGWEEEGCGCLEGCDEPRCARLPDEDYLDAQRDEMDEDPDLRF